MTLDDTSILNWEAVSIAYDKAKEIDAIQDTIEVTRTTASQASGNSIHMGFAVVTSDSSLKIIQNSNAEMTIKVSNTASNLIDVSSGNPSGATTIVLFDMLEMTNDTSYMNKPTTRWHDSEYVKNWLITHGCVNDTWVYTNDTDVKDMLAVYYKDKLLSANYDIDLTIKSIVNNLSVSASALQSNTFDYKIVNVSNGSNVTIEMSNDSVQNIEAILNDYAKEVNDVKGVNDDVDSSVSTPIVTQDTNTSVISSLVSNSVASSVSSSVNTNDDSNDSDDGILILVLIVILMIAIGIGVIYVIKIKYSANDNVYVHRRVA